MWRTRWLLAGATALAGLCVFATCAGAAAPPAQLSNPGCQTALFPAARRIALTGVMRPVSGTMTMRMMFDLERAPRRGGAFRPVHGHGLGVWVRPGDPTLGQRPGDVWRFDQRVEDLYAPAYYRFRVRFRWTGAHNRILGAATQRGPLCFQPELRPDLLLRSLTIKPAPGGGGQDEYVAVIGNRGRTGAGPFDVELTQPGSSPQSTPVGHLGAHGSVRETFFAPACTSGRPVTVVVDPNRDVADYDRANNTLTQKCP